MADGRDIPDQAIASALEFAVGLAAAGTKIKPQLPFPRELRPYLKFQQLKGKALSEVRRIVEADQEFLRRLGSVATADLVDEAGMLWLTRPDGWAERLADLTADASGGDLAADLRRAEKRRVAAEQAALKAVAEIAALRAENARLAEAAASASADAVAARREREALRTELATQQTEVRHALDRVAAAVARADRADAGAAEARARAVEAERTRDEVLATRAASAVRAHADDAILAGAATLSRELDEQVDSAHRLAKELTRLSESLAALEPAARPPVVDAPRPRRGKTGRATRRPVALPGGIYGSSFAASEYLARHQGVVVLVDGYNVAKLAWPRLTLEHQRDRAIDVSEDVARKFGTNVTLVFDGANVVGASAPSRRLVRVLYSPAGVTADDLLRGEVARLPDETPIVVVTNDQAIATDVRAAGANTMTSEQWLELAGCR